MIRVLYYLKYEDLIKNNIRVSIIVFEYIITYI